MGSLPEPLLFVLLSVALVALVVSLAMVVVQIRRRHSTDKAARVRLQRTTVLASAVGMFALGTITIANLASNG